MNLRLAACLSTTFLTVATGASAGTVTVEQHGGRNVRVFVPTTPASPVAMVVMLHGCTQTPDAFADGTRMDEIAEKEGFVVAYPEQPSSTIPTRCFQWYAPAHQARDAGEPKEIADATAAIATAKGVDAGRVYVAGISAGAAMSVILGATYPDRFTAIGVIAGVEYKAATTVSEGISVAQGGGPDPDQQGMVAFTQMGTRARAVPTFVLHGTSDGVLAKVNGDQVAAQWRRTNTLVLGEGAIDEVKSVSGTAGYPFTRFLHLSKTTGASVVEYYVVDGLGHAWPGGKAGGSYTDVRGPDASALMWAFFKGRTLAKPLDGPPVATGEPGTTGDGGAGGGSSGTGGPTSDGGPAPSSSGDDGGGCTAGRMKSGLAPSVSLAGIASIMALAAVIARSRRARR